MLCIGKAGVFIDTGEKTFLCEEHLSEVADKGEADDFPSHRHTYSMASC